MHFGTIEHRRVTIKELRERKEIKREIDEYHRQVQCYSIMDKDKIMIDKSDIADVMYLSIYNESKKPIGMLKLTLSNDEKVGYLEISIPNPEWSWRYGTEAVHQFVKRCSKTSIEELILNEENAIVSRYKSERPELFSSNKKSNNNQVQYKYLKA